MTIENLIKVLTEDTPYTIVYTDNPRYIWWYGRGCNCQSIPKSIIDKEVKGIQYTKKNLKIYV